MHIKAPTPHRYPGKDAPRGTHSVPGGIIEHKEDGKGKWRLRVEYCDPLDEYEPVILWKDLADIWQECQVYVERGEEDTNFVLVYARKLKSTLPHSLAESLGTLANKTAVDLFPAYKKKLTTKTKKQSTAPRVVDQEISTHCTKDHNNRNCFEELAFNNYFHAGCKYEDSECAVCKFRFPTETNMAKKDWAIRGLHADGGIVLSLPTGRNPVYVCVDYLRDRSDCGNICCGDCVAGLQTTKRGRK